MSEKSKEILSNVVGYIVIFLTCALYVLTAILVLNPTGKTIGQIVADGLMAFGVGVSMDYMFRLQGVINGKKDSLVNNTMILYGKTVEKINPFINRLSNWCSIKNKNTLKEERTKILSRAGLRIDDYFEEDGVAKPFLLEPKFEDYVKDENCPNKKVEKTRIKNIKRRNKDIKKDFKYKKKCYWLAVKLRLTELRQADLTSEGSKKSDPNNLGQTVNEYLTMDSAKSVVVKIFLSLAIGLYGIALIDDFSFIELLWRAFQVCLFTTFGIIKMMKTKMFIVNDYRGRIIRKIDYLEEFYVDVKGEQNEQI